MMIINQPNNITKSNTPSHLCKNIDPLKINVIPNRTAPAKDEKSIHLESEELIGRKTAIDKERMPERANNTQAGTISKKTDSLKIYRTIRKLPQKKFESDMIRI